MQPCCLAAFKAVLILAAIGFPIYRCNREAAKHMLIVLAIIVICFCGFSIVPAIATRFDN